MKGDFSRLGFDPAKHYDAVLLQQGRVALDSDANEATAIGLHRDRRTTADVVGPSGAPLTDAGFAIALAPGGKLSVGPGALYVDGLRCSNAAPFLHDDQPYLPDGAPVFIAADGSLATTPADGRYIALIDVWHRHVTGIEDSDLVEEALGVDTATRSQIVSQVKFLRAEAAGAAAVSCDAAIPAWTALVAPPNGTLKARGKPADDSANPCAFPETAGYQRLENHLYRVEIHRSGSVGGGATFKWSRDNAAQAMRWLESNGDMLTLSDTGRDALTGLRPGQWIELTDDDRELQGQPGTLVRIISLTGTRVRIDGATADGPIAIASFGRNPKVRGWDSPGAVAATVPGSNDGYLVIESGLEIAFAAATRLRSGDWWTIPARSGSGIDWPGTSSNPTAVPPQGIAHAYARLAILDCVGGVWTFVADCRPLFPALTALRQIAMLGGDGQEALPNPLQPAVLCPLPRPLRAGVFRGTAPVANARVRFRVIAGTGRLDTIPATAPAGQIEARTDAQGEATCSFALDAVTASQQVRAELLDSTGAVVGLPITFNASLSTAALTSFDPAAAPSLAGIVTVQRAIEELANRVGTGCVEVTLSPGTDWAEILKKLPKGRDVTICFKQGDFTTDSEVVVEGLGHVIVHGGGAATRIIGREGETALEFVACASIDMRDLSIAAVQDSSKNEPNRNGALTVTGCPFVTLSHLDVACGAGLGDGRTCITVRAFIEEEKRQPLDRVSIIGCILRAGFGQGGILVTDALVSDITGNVLTVAPLPKGWDYDMLATDPKRLGLLAQHLARDVTTSDDERFMADQPLIIGGYKVEMNSVLGVAEWRELVKNDPPKVEDRQNADSIVTYMKRITNRALTEPETAPIKVRETVATVRKAMGAQAMEVTDEKVSDFVRGADMTVSEAPKGAAINVDGGHVAITVGPVDLAFDSMLNQAAWDAIVRKHMEELKASDADEAREALDRLIKRFITDAEMRRTAPPVAKWFDTLAKGVGVVGAQAIAVAGGFPGVARVTGNRAANFAEGIRAGLSRDTDTREDRRTFDSVTISDNRMSLRMPVERLFGGSGIYVGNVARARVNDNDLDHASRSGKPRRFGDGIRLWGALGDFIHVRNNVVTCARIGIRVIAEDEPPRDAPVQWLAADNHAPGSRDTIIAPAAMRLVNNTP